MVFGSSHQLTAPYNNNNNNNNNNDNNNNNNNVVKDGPLWQNFQDPRMKRQVIVE